MKDILVTVQVVLQLDHPVMIVEIHTTRIDLIGGIHTVLIDIIDDVIVMFIMHTAQIDPVDILIVMIDITTYFHITDKNKNNFQSLYGTQESKIRHGTISY